MDKPVIERIIQQLKESAEDICSSSQYMAHLEEIKDIKKGVLLTFEIKEDV
jgi:hypothetical protein